MAITRKVHGYDVPLKYFTTIKDGYKYNKGIYTCIECRKDCIDGIYSKYSLGIANHKFGIMHVWECPKCFQRQYFHLRDFCVSVFLAEREEYEEENK